MRQIFVILLGLMLPLLMSGCREEGIDGTVEMTLYDIVTFNGNIDGRADFTLVKVDDTPEINLTADRSLDVEQDRIPGRMLISYIPAGGKAYESGPVTLLSASLINSADVLTTWHDEYDGWDSDGVYLYSIWRSGRYINIHVRLTYTVEPRVFCMAADPSTLLSDYPDIYLVHILESPVDSHDRAYYASFDLSPVWDSDNVKGVRIHIANTNLDKQIFTFEKSSVAGL